MKINQRVIEFIKNAWSWLCFGIMVLVPIAMMFTVGRYAFINSKRTEQVGTYLLPPHYKITQHQPDTSDKHVQMISPLRMFTNAFWGQEILIYPQKGGVQYYARMGDVYFVSPYESYAGVSGAGLSIQREIDQGDGKVLVTGTRSWTEIIVSGILWGLILGLLIDGFLYLIYKLATFLLWAVMAFVSGVLILINKVLPQQSRS